MSGKDDFIAKVSDLLASMKVARQGRGNCGTLPFMSTEGEDIDQSSITALWMLAKWALVWAVMWYVFAGFCSLVVHRLPKSTKARENGAVYLGYRIVATVRAFAVAMLANQALLLSYDENNEQRMMLGHNLAEIAGVMFTSFEITDLILGGLHGYLDLEFFIHHILHIILGLFIRLHCCFWFTASLLMTQETSTVPLSLYIYMRHRLPDHWLTTASFLVFAPCFIFWRCGLGTYGAYFFVTNIFTHSPPWVPDYQKYAISGTLISASVLQWFWLIQIVKSVVRKLKGSKKDNKTSKSE